MPSSHNNSYLKDYKVTTDGRMFIVEARNILDAKRRANLIAAKDKLEIKEVEKA